DSMNVQTCEKLGAFPRLIDPDASLFQEQFNRVSFQFSHFLGDHPLFEIPRLLELAKSQPDGDVYFDAGDIRVNQRWDQSPKGQWSVDQLIDRIENGGVWILLKRVQRDPRYSAVFDQGLAEIQSLVGAPFPKKILRRSAVILVTSPNRTTAYHIDPDCNFLFQIRGKKL